MIVKLETINITEIARLVYAQDHRFHEAIKAAEHVLRRDLREVPRSDRMFHWLQQRVFADALSTAQHQCVIDLLARMLDAVCQPSHDVIEIVGIDFMDMVKPSIGGSGISQFDHRRAIQVETADIIAIDPTALRDQLVTNDHGQPWCPSHLLDRFVLIEPR